MLPILSELNTIFLKYGVNLLRLGDLQLFCYIFIRNIVLILINFDKTYKMCANIYEHFRCRILKHCENIFLEGFKIKIK